MYHRVEIEKPPPLWLRILTPVVWVILIVVNSILFRNANVQTSADYPTPITPAGWAFSIWGIIFLLQLFGAIYVALPYQYTADGWKTKVANITARGWIVGWICESLWQYFFNRADTFGFIVSLILIVAAAIAFQVTLFFIWNLGEGHLYQFKSLETVLCFIFFFLGTSINAAWLTPASSINVLVLLLKLGTSQQTLVSLGIFLAIVVTVLGMFWAYYRYEIPYVLTLIWAFVAIYDKSYNQTVRISIFACIIVLIVFTVLSILVKELVLRRRSKKEGLLSSQI